MTAPKDESQQGQDPSAWGRMPVPGKVLLVWYIAMVVIAIATGEVTTVLLAALGLTALVLPGLWWKRRRRRGS